RTGVTPSRCAGSSTSSGSRGTRESASARAPRDGGVRRPCRRGMPTLMAREATARARSAQDSSERIRALVERAQSDDREALEELPEPHGEAEPSAEAIALQSIGRQSMLEMIESLSEEQQQVLTLKFVFNFPNAEVATILGKTEGAIKSLQHRALVSLQKQLAPDET